MSAWGHRLRPASQSEAEYGCPSCKRPNPRKRAVCALEYNYVTGRAGRVSYARKPRCEEHARKAAERYDLMDEFRVLREAGFPLVEFSDREAFWRKLIDSASAVG